jgi:UDP-N-acetylglucosamine 2-epimerase
MSGRHVAVITGTRAEYGLLSPLMACLRDDPRTELSIIATGTHLEPTFGHTIDEIRADGFEITCEVPLGLNSDTRQDIADATAAGLSGMARALAGLKPDIAVVLGDRYEIFAAAAAATLSVIPLAHIHGGETTLGAMTRA